MSIEAAIIAAAGRDSKRTQEAIAGFMVVKEWLDERGLLDSPLRLAHLLGQCAHESTGFTRTVENLKYTTAERIRLVFGKRRFPSLVDAQAFIRQPRLLANKVYGGRMGNTRPDDGWRYRGRGWLQLTGRDNYKRFGASLGMDLDGQPELAATPQGAWKIAGAYLAIRARAGQTALEWADLDNVEMVTRIVNGGINGLADRQARTALALKVLERTWPT